MANPQIITISLRAYCRLCAIVFILTSNFVLAQLCTAEFKGAGKDEPGKGTISCEDLGGGTMKWTIKHPEVRQPLTEYNDIEFRAEDRVTVEAASGCVDTGGHGNTWKRYVDPSGDNTDRLYHGLIWIPGAKVRNGADLLITPVATFPVRISGVLNQEFTIQERPGERDPFLRLGYEDDQFDDNGYPPGPRYMRKGNGCEHLPDASVTIQVVRGQSADSQTAGQPMLLPFDPVSHDYDPNGFLLAPAWFGNYTAWDLGKTPTYLKVLKNCENFPYDDPVFVHHGVASPCSRQASFDVPQVLTTCLLEPGLGELHGHVNWAPATYYGKIYFTDFSPDNDLDFDLKDLSRDDVAKRFQGWKPPGFVGAILPEDSQGDSQYKGRLHMEFAGYEVTEFFAAPWDMFHYVSSQRVDQQADLIRSRMDENTAVVSGLLDLDCVHECHAELHPIHAMAFRTRRENCSQAEGCNDRDILLDDSWMIFARNFGNEGSCSLDEHYLGRESYSVLLPAPANSKGPPKVDEQTVFTSNKEGLHWNIEYKQAEHGVLITFFFNPGGSNHLIAGEPIRVSGVLHLNWGDTATQPGPYALFDENLKRPPGTKGSEGSSKRASSAPGFQGAPHVLDLNPVRRGLPPPPDPCGGPQCGDDAFIVNQLVSNAQEFARERQYLRDLRKQKGSFSWRSAIKMVLTSYWQSNVGFFDEALHSNQGQGFQLGLGSRVELFQTPLGSAELDLGLGFFSTSVAARNSNARTLNWMLGPRVQVTRHGGLFVEVKGGNLYRQARFSRRPDLMDFMGHDAFAYYGVGGQPGFEKARTRFRYSAGVMVLPGTGEKIIRITFGTQIKFRKKDSD